MNRARVSRLHCPTHGIRQLRVVWAEPSSRFTALFEALHEAFLKLGCILICCKFAVRAF